MCNTSLRLLNKRICFQFSLLKTFTKTHFISFCQFRHVFHEIFFLYFVDPPTELCIFTPIVEGTILLKEGFGKYVLNSESHTDISCSSVMITWVSQTEGNIKSCQAEGK